MIISRQKPNKRGVIVFFIFFLILISIVIIGFILAMTTGVLGIFTDNFQPIGTELGVIGTSNVSEAFDYAYTPVDTLINAMPWLFGFGIAAAFFFSIVFAVAMRYNPHPVLMGLYFMMMLLIIFGAIVMSNMYEDVWEGNDELATQLQDQQLTSYMIIYSPAILVMITAIAGIYFFAGPKDTIGEFGI